MKKRNKIIVSSVLSIAMCASLIAGSTFALFSSESKTNIAITSGKVSVVASVESVEYASDITDTYPEEGWSPASASGDSLTGTFVNGGTVTYVTKDNKLTLDRVSPGDAVRFTLKIENESTISAKYRVQVKPVEDTGLAEHLKFTANGTELSVTHATALAKGWIPLEAGADPADVAVTIALPSAVTSEQAGEKSCSLTLGVLALQANGPDATPCYEEGGEHVYGADHNCIWGCGEKDPMSSFYSGSGEKLFEEEDDTVIIGGCDETITDLEIPHEIAGKTVELKENAFKGNTSLESVTLGEGFTDLPGSAFYGCKGLQTVNLPDSISSIGASAFYGCTHLESVDLPDNLSSIGDSAFRSCTSLGEIDIPDTVTEISDNAFYGCSNLESVTLSETLSSIGGSAFRNCTSLDNLTIPDSVTSIGSYGFYGCSGLETVKLGAGITELKNFTFKNTGLKNITIPENLTKIGDEVFNGCYELTSFTMEAATQSNGKWVTKTIGSNAFRFCTELAEVSLPEGLSAIGQDAFYGCKSLHAIGLPSTLTVLGSGMGRGSMSKDRGNVFNGCTALESIVLPASLKVLETSTFKDCTALASVVIETDVLNYLGGSIFENCLSLTEIALPALGVQNDVPATSITSGMFKGCDKLKTVYVKGGEKLEGTVRLPAQVTSIKQDAFNGCKSIQQIELKGITEIGKSALANSGLTEVELPDTITTYSGSDEILSGCTSLTKVTVTKPVYTDRDRGIGLRTFKGCTNLETVVFKGSTDDWIDHVLTVDKGSQYTTGAVLVDSCIFEDIPEEHEITIQCLDGNLDRQGNPIV